MLRPLRFVAVGASGLAVNLVVFAALHAAGVPAATGAFAVAVANNFWWNRTWTFWHARGSPRRRRRGPRRRRACRGSRGRARPATTSRRARRIWANLTEVIDGRSETTVNVVTLKELRSESSSINVHDPEHDNRPLVCGDIPRAS